MDNSILREKMSKQNERVLRRKRFQLRLLEGWWLIAVAILAIYVSLPMAAPVLMKVGATAPANAIYSTYSFMCHQFAFRSIFLFGEQTFYPRESAGSNLVSFDERAPQSSTFVELYQQRRGDDFEGAYNPQELTTWSRSLQMASRSFKGDEAMGYKMALCQRDIAIYVAMTGAGIVYGFVRRRLRPVPLYLYVLLGIAPIALDGFSQLLGYPPFELWDPRETLPMFRILTGALFGIMNVWLAFPYINMTMQDSADRLRYVLEKVDDRLTELANIPEPSAD